MIRSVSLALAFVLIGSVAWTEPTDYVLTIREHGIDTIICAKSLATCEAARDAIRTGKWPIADPGAVTSCTPSPMCFDPASNVIKGYNDK